MDGWMDSRSATCAGIEVILNRLGGTYHPVVFKAEVFVVDRVHLTAHQGYVQSPGSSIQKSIHFLPFIKWFGLFFFHSEAIESQFFLG
jgi:hypothetical protein